MHDSRDNISSAATEAAWIRTDNRLFDRTSIITMLIGLILFMVGIGVDLSTAKYPEIGDILRNCQAADPKCVAALHTFDIKAHGESELDWWILAAETLKAVGLTIIAAVFISSTVDHRTRNYFFRQLSLKTAQLGENVLNGMFESKHPDRLFELVKLDIFQKKIIRRNIDISYTFSDLQFPDEGHRLFGKHFILVDVILSTVSENVNTSRGRHDGSVSMPIGLALPNPMFDELKPYTKINGFRVGDDELAKEEVSGLNDLLQERLKDDTAVDAAVSIREVTLPFGRSLTVSGSYTMVKELEDTEVFRTVEIAENIHLTVVNKSAVNLVIRARSMSHAKLHYQGSPSAKQWKLDDLSLPLQGIMVWWKRPLPPKGEIMQSVVQNGSAAENTSPAA